MLLVLYRLFCPSTIRVEMLAYLMYVVEKTGQNFLDKRSRSLVGVSEGRTKRFRPIFSAHRPLTKTPDLLSAHPVITAALVSYLTKPLVQNPVQVTVLCGEGDPFPSQLHHSRG